MADERMHWRRELFWDDGDRYRCRIREEKPGRWLLTIWDFLADYVLHQGRYNSANTAQMAAKVWLAKRKEKTT